MKKLYVGNLPFEATGSDLEELFAGFGEVQSAQVIEDRNTGRSRGFGFVEMGSEHAAQAAVDGLHNQEYGGRPLTVIEARPREARAGNGGYSGGYSNDRGRGGYDRGGYGGRY